MPDHNYFSNLIWQIAGLLRGPYRPLQYEQVMLSMPPPNRQRAIAVHIARETTKLAAVLAVTGRTISLLKERLAALIAAAMTGQIDAGVTS